SCPMWCVRACGTPPWRQRLPPCVRRFAIRAWRASPHADEAHDGPDEGYLSLMPEDPVASAVDTRFALANERTLLAWTRTSLALLASGGALQQLSDIPARKPL